MWTHSNTSHCLLRVEILTLPTLPPLKYLTQTLLLSLLNSSRIGSLEDLSIRQHH